MAVNILLCVRNKLATDGDRQPNCILVKIFFLPFTRRLTAEREMRDFFLVSKNFRKNKTKNKIRWRKGWRSYTQMRHVARSAKLSIPSAASLTFLLVSFGRD
jgi:hypothetical protein